MDFSFSGLKTALLLRAEEKGWYPPDPDIAPDPVEVGRVAAAYQEALVDSMVRRAVESAATFTASEGILLGGGVAANSLLRQELADRAPVPIIVPRPALCTDNGAMIGAAAWFHLRDAPRYDWDMDAVPNLKLC